MPRLLFAAMLGGALAGAHWFGSAGGVAGFFAPMALVLVPVLALSPRTPSTEAS